MLGLSFETFVLLHTLISIIAIVTGLIALVGMLRGAAPDWVTHVFLATTALTTITGFMFPITVLHAGAGDRHRLDGAVDPRLRRPLRLPPRRALGAGST